MSTRPSVYFVQFPHPGAERLPRVDEMPWNVGDHRRKFLVSPGRCVDASGRLSTEELVFWGEWEAPSHVERRWPASGRLPRALHHPYWTTPKNTSFRQNTDPWIWGEHMIYSNCKQIVGPDRKATSMQRLTEGSVICFGSTIGQEFCLDTVLVIASAEPWVPANARTLDVNEAFITCTADSVATSPMDGRLTLTLYRGATIDNAIEGMYSFVPVLMTDHPSKRFARPSVTVPGLINPASRQSTWGSKRPLDFTRVHDAWRAVADQVLASGLVLGVSFALPERRGGQDVVPSGGRNSC